MVWTLPSIAAVALCASLVRAQETPEGVAPPPADLLTVAEASGFEATATHAEVMDLAARLAARGPSLRLLEMGQTVEGRTIPLLVLADPPIASADEAAVSGKPIVFVLANIHAGEVCGKEATMMLARELCLAPQHPLLRELVIVLAPNYNADGNDKMSPDNRPGQDGPRRGMGRRENAQGFDLNRDYVKLESPEARALVAFLDRWDPHLTIDCHTTNGSRHRYTLTYDAPLNPAGHPAAIELVRDHLLPEVSRRLEQRTGYLSFFYGNFNRGHTTWEAYGAEPRYGANYQGLRGQMSVLSEAYSYAPFRDRVLCTLEFVREILQYVAEHDREIVELRERVARETVEAGRRPQPGDTIGLRFRPAAWPAPVTVKGYEQGSNGAAGARDYPVVHLGRFEPTLSVRRPLGYLLDTGLDSTIEKLRQHGIDIEPYEGRAIVERYTITTIDRSERPFQGHRLVRLEVTAGAPETITAAPGTLLVRCAQPLGTLAVALLEPQAEDGLAAWNFLDDHLREGAAYPVLRVLDLVGP